MVIETVTFRLGPGVDAPAFVDADRRVQTEFAYRQPGLLRRTTARGSGGDWIVVTLWDTAGDAEAARRLSEDHPATRAFAALIDGASVRRAVYEPLD